VNVSEWNERREEKEREEKIGRWYYKVIFWVMSTITMEHLSECTFPHFCISCDTIFMVVFVWFVWYGV
jgi:hypothetical protein